MFGNFHEFCMGPHNTCFGTHALGSNPLNMHHTLIVVSATLPVDVVRNRNFLENVVQTNNYNDICLFLYDIFTLSMNAFVKNLQMIYKVVVVKCNPRLVCKTTLFGRTVP